MGKVAKGALALVLIAINESIIWGYRMPLILSRGNKRIISLTSRLSYAGPLLPTSSPRLMSSSIPSIQDDTSKNDSYVKKADPQIKKEKSTVKAPLVDSTLLRFLSAQKSQNVISEQRGYLEQINDPQNVVQNAAESENEEENAYSVDGFDSNASLSSETIPTESVNTGDTPAECLSWFTQYNSYRVSQKLISMGVEERSALEAGNVVQNYVMMRTTRQRISKFLRDRDAIWAMDSSSILKKQSLGGRTNYEVSNLYEGAAFRGDVNNLDKVISLFTEAGLTGKDIAAIFTHTPGVTMMMASRPTNGDGEGSSNEAAGDGETLEDTLSRAYFVLLCKTLKLRKYDARKVLRTCPGLLTKRGSLSAEEVVKILSSLGVSANSLLRNKASLPILLSRSPASLFRLVAFLCGDGVRMSVDKIGPFIRRPECAELLDAVAPLPQSNSNILDFSGHGLDRYDEAEENPVLPTSVFGDDTEPKSVNQKYKEMHHTAKFLRRSIGIKDLGKVMSACPSILLLNARNQILPTVKFLYENVGIEEEDVPKVIESFPLLLAANVTKMEEVVDYLISLEVSEDMLGSIFRAFPALLTFDVKTKMMPVVEFLQSIGVTNIGRFITRLPPVLGYSVEDELSPKWQFLKKNCQYASFEVRRFPAYFSYPLDRVIVSRYEYLRDVKRMPVNLLPVDDVLRYGDKDFASIVAQDSDNGENFIHYLSARSQTNRKVSKKIHGKKRSNSGHRNNEKRPNYKKSKIGEKLKSDKISLDFKR